MVQRALVGLITLLIALAPALSNAAEGTWSFTGTMLEWQDGPTGTVLPDGKVLIAGGMFGSRGAQVYDPSTGLFSQTGSLNEGRYQHGAVLLPNGKVLIIGGYRTENGIDVYAQRAELYDPASGTFSLAAEMRTGRAGHTATLMGNGKVLIAGGVLQSTGYLASVELYDPQVDTFSLTASMEVPRATHTATLLNDGKVLIAGGSDGHSPLGSVQLYDPATESFTWSGVLGSARFAHTADLLPNGKVLLAGGMVSGGATGAEQSASAELFDPGDRSFAATGSLTYARMGHRAAQLPNGKILMVGGPGQTIQTAAEVYDPATGTFSDAGSTMGSAVYPAVTPLRNGMVLVAGGGVLAAELYCPLIPGTPGTWAPTGSLPEARGGATATRLLDGSVLIAGGQAGDQLLALAEIYSPQTRNFAPTSNSLSSARRWHTATLLRDGKVLIAGGATRLGAPLPTRSAVIYDPASRLFAETGAMLVPRYQHTATLLPNGKVLIAGGLSDTGQSDTAEIYDPAAAQFSTAPGSLVAARYGHTATLLRSGKVLLAGGYGIAGYLPDAELYDWTTGAFSAASQMNIGRYLHTATLLPSGQVMVAGGVGLVAPETSGWYLASAELYDPALGFLPAGSLAIERQHHTATLLPNGKVLVAGGSNATGHLASAELFDPVGRAFSPIAPMTAPRAEATATLLTNGTVLVAGGTSGTPSSDIYTPVVCGGSCLLRVEKTGPGTGTITSDVGGIDCGSACSASIPLGGPVTLTALPVDGSTFIGWDRAGCVTAAPCTFTINEATTVTAIFGGAAVQAYPLTVQKSGTGGGTITSSHNGIACGSTCSASVPAGNTVTLTAVADSASVLTGWSEAACGSDSTCAVTMTSARTVTATFGGRPAATYRLGVIKDGTGGGAVRSDDIWIDCGWNSCNVAVPAGNTVVLVAAPDSQSFLIGWSEDACGNSLTCPVTVTGPMSITATFGGRAAGTRLLTVTKTGTGSGTITSKFGEINCGSICSGSVPEGNQVILTAQRNAGSVFAGWGGDCAGTGLCVVHAKADRNVTAAFVPVPSFSSLIHEVLHSFDMSEGRFPRGTVVQGNDGALYGTTAAGGAADKGTVFWLTPDGMLETIHSFGGGDGQDPLATLVQGSNGNFYGTTRAGGTAGAGTIFRVASGSLRTADAWHWFGGDDRPGFGPRNVGVGQRYTVPSNFTLTAVSVPFTYCGAPRSLTVPIRMDLRNSSGSILATQERSLDLSQMTDGCYAERWVRFPMQYQMVGGHTYNFTWWLPDGYSSSITLSSPGKYNQGSDAFPGGTGLRAEALQDDLSNWSIWSPHTWDFLIDIEGAPLSLTTFHSFTGSDGGFPVAGLVGGSDGNFYGTTLRGGTNGIGTVFRLLPSGEVATLHSFTGSDGELPHAALVQGSDENFYGTTSGGGAGVGTVFTISLAGLAATLHSFTGSDGELPYAALVQGSDGRFYGTTRGGTATQGTVFAITPTGELTILHSFDGSAGKYPHAALIEGNDGQFYGTTLGDGADRGTVFRISPAGALTTLHRFSGSDGERPYAALVQASDGNFYGTTSEGGAASRGTVFILRLANSVTVTTSGSGTVTSTPAGIACGADATCSANFRLDRPVTLTASSTTGSLLWDGACAGVTGNTCTVTPDAVKTVSVVFTATPPTVSPIVTGISPASAPQGTANQPVTITGENFAAGATVELGSGVSVGNVTVVSATQITAEITIQASAAVGTRDVSVTVASVAGALPAGFSVIAAAPVPPTATGTDRQGSVTIGGQTCPLGLLQGRAGQPITIYGTGFQPASETPIGLAFDPTSGITVVGSVFYGSPTTLHAVVDVAAGAALEPRKVTVINPDGSAGTSGDVVVDVVASAANCPTWARTRFMDQWRDIPTATQLADGRVLIVGGSSWDSVARTTVYPTTGYLFNPSTGAFAPTANELSSGRQFHTATRLHDGRVLVAGGQANNVALDAVDIFDPSTNRFSPGRLGVPRTGHTATLLGDGRVLIAGGSVTSEQDEDYLASVEVYDPQGDVFSLLEDRLKVARSMHTATLLPSGLVLIAGGHGGWPLDSAEVYDPSTGASTLTGSLAMAREAHTANALPDGKVLVVGGSGMSGYLTSAEIYDPSIPGFSAIAEMAQARWAHASAPLSDGSVLIVGGYGNSEVLSSAEVYVPATGSLSPTAPMRGAGRYLAAAPLASGAVFVVGGGRGAEVYCPTGCTFGTLTTAGAPLDIQAPPSTGTPLGPQAVADIEIKEILSDTLSTSGRITVTLPEKLTFASLPIAELADFNSQLTIDAPSVDGGQYSFAIATQSITASASIVIRGIQVTAAPGFAVGPVFAQMSGPGVTPASVRIATAVPAHNTPAGVNVQVLPLDSTTGGTPATLTFGSVTLAGTTSMTSGTTGPTPPTGFSLGSPPIYYDISTTATVSGSVNICINYSASNFLVVPPRLFHHEGYAWQDVTTSQSASEVCGVVSSLSPFALFQDTTPPVIEGLPGPGCTLWPPNHKLVKVGAVSGADAGSGLVSPVAISATSSEPDSGLEKGDVPGDIVIQDGAIQLRAERAGKGAGRTYTITATATDRAGNVTTATARCVVPHDQRK